MFGTRVRCYYFSSCTCSSHCNYLLNGTSEEAAASCFSLSLWHPNPKPQGELYISLPFTCWIYCQILLLHFIFAAFFVSLHCCSCLYLNDSCHWNTLPISSPPVQFLPAASVQIDPFCSSGISILTLKSYMGFPSPQELSSQSLPMSGGQALSELVFLIPSNMSGFFTFSRLSEFSSS